MSSFHHSGCHGYKEEESAAEGWMLVYNCGEIELCTPLGGDTPPMGGVSPISGVWAAERGESPTHQPWGKNPP